MNTPDDLDWTTPTPGDEELETALRESAARLRAQPSPHLTPRVLENIRAQAVPAAATRPHSPAPPLRARTLTWMGLAAAGLLTLVLWTGESPAEPPRTTTGTPEVAGLPTPPPHPVSPWRVDGLVEGNASLLSRQLEQPLLDEVGGWKLDAERAAAVVLEPLLRSLLQLQLRPSLHADDSAFGESFSQSFGQSFSQSSMK